MLRRSWRHHIPAISLALLILWGCGGPDGPELGFVSGVVTLDEEPLPHAEITFHPQGPGGSISLGLTDESGQYEMKFTRRKEGAMVGSHRVQITTAVERVEGGHMVRAKERVPARYNQQTELTAEVEPGDNTIDFPLKSDGRIIEERN